MTDEEAKKYFESISKNVELIQKKTGGRFSSLFNGVLSGFGSVLGAAIALTIIGWVLNFVGVIPALKQEATKWQQLLQSTTTYKSAPARGNQ